MRKALYKDADGKIHQCQAGIIKLGKALNWTWCKIYIPTDAPLQFEKLEITCETCKEHSNA